MAWMASQNNIVLFGGSTALTLSQTWVWDGTNWTQKSPATTPPARYYQGMAPDSAHNQVVMFGGSSGGGFANALNDTWVWDGTNWTVTVPGYRTPGGLWPFAGRWPHRAGALRWIGLGRQRHRAKPGCGTERIGTCRVP